MNDAHSCTLAGSTLLATGNQADDQKSCPKRPTPIVPSPRGGGLGWGHAQDSCGPLGLVQASPPPRPSPSEGEGDPDGAPLRTGSLVPGLAAVGGRLGHLLAEGHVQAAA